MRHSPCRGCSPRHGIGTNRELSCLYPPSIAAGGSRIVLSSLRSPQAVWLLRNLTRGADTRVCWIETESSRSLSDLLHPVGGQPSVPGSPSGRNQTTAALSHVAGGSDRTTGRTPALSTARSRRVDADERRSSDHSGRGG